ncbi:MAG TPA: TetR/AcrR family transcriptional regulator [Solirubrobacteraceae bacterium]|jgi:AcrR family transcriptional regulator
MSDPSSPGDSRSDSSGREVGLREHKKQQTRDAIARAATELFASDGFGSVTVAQIARAANVSRQTVFNYFATKEEMLFDRDSEVLDALLASIRGRADGSLVDAFRGHTISFWRRIESGGDGDVAPAAFWRVVQSSPSLRDYAEVVFARHARAVAGALADERELPGDDPSCHALARVLCSVNAAILTCGLDRIAAGQDAVEVAREMITEAGRAYDVIDGVK